MTTENTHNSENTLTNAVFIATRTTLSKAFRIFVRTTEAAVTPETFGSKAQWAIEHDNTYDYHTHTVLNSENKNRLDDDYKSLISSDGYAQQQLHLLEESTPTNEEESEIKETAITYIKTWLELMHTEYNNFLDSVTLDEETLSEKWDLIRENLKDNYYSDIRSEYMSVMQEYEAWTDDEVQEWYENDGEVPEDFVSDYLDEI